jgi:hypothetical protein
VNQIRAEHRAVVASALIQAEPITIFEILADVTRHAEIDGSGMLIGDAIGPKRLSLGAEFTVSMRQPGRAYRSFNRVVEFDDGQRIAWESMGVWRGRKIVGGQRLAMDSHGHRSRDPRSAQLRLGVRQSANSDGMALWVSGSHGAGAPQIIGPPVHRDQHVRAGRPHKRNYVD